MAGQKNDYGKRSHYQSDNHPGNGGGKRRNPEEERESHAIGPEDTVYRYLCPVGMIGSIIGRGGDIVKQLRADTNAKIRINELVPGCDERVVVIYSNSEETNSFGDSDDYVSPAQDALFKVHDRIIAEDPPADDQFDEIQQVSVRLLVAADQIGCVIGKGGQVVSNIRNETHTQIRILHSEHLPPCALRSDELLQINGDVIAVRKALFQVACRLHDNPSRTQHLLLSSSANLHKPVVNYTGASSMMAPYGNWSANSKDFSLRLVCPTENIGSVIGKSGSIIKQIRQESGASIKVDSSAAEGDDCLIIVSAKESFEEMSPTIDAALRLVQRCSEKTERDSGDTVYTTRLLIPKSKVGGLIGKGGAIIAEMRSLTRASIRILRDENLPKVASEDEEMVQITGDINVVSSALLQVATRLRANIFDMDGAVMTLPPTDSYGSYGGSQVQVDGSGYGAYGVYTGRMRQ
ncbi:RNA-binding KH domain-containing protein RCF3 [Rutidosis leptorrhynchoides]|uniref:RNA-binding KH domain-containing protein RCF3 n=1 Tax=Rutidosis leptorrhynchoides TaxID=125765 RepID=UPI003A994EDB